MNIPDAVEAYAEQLVAPEDEVLRTVRAAQREAGLPEIQISPLEGKILLVLLRAIGARRVLEVGTLGGYSTVWLSRALPQDGRVVTIEGDERHAAFARSAFERAGIAHKVELIEGEALDTLPALTPAFDAVFLDADKAPLPRYFDESARLLRRGGLLLCDNTFMDGRIVDPQPPSTDVAGMRAFNDLVAADPRFATAVIPVRDGLLVAVKLAD